MKVWSPPVGSLLVDTVSTVMREDCCYLRDVMHVRGVIRYLGSLTADEQALILSEGLAVGYVTFAKAWNGLQALQHLSHLAAPPDATVFLDVEDVAMDPVTLAGAITSWSRPLANGGFDPGCYFGAKCLLTSEEMYALPATRKYWHSCSRVVDRFGKEAAPQCGWVVRQLFPPNIDLEIPINRDPLFEGASSDVHKLRVDLDVVEQDYSGRQVHMVVA